MKNIITNHKIETITSIEAAQIIGKEHKELLRDIRRYSNQIIKINKNNMNDKIILTDLFQESTYKSKNNKILPCFNLTPKGYEFIITRLTGQRGTEFAIKYINKSHELEKENITASIITRLNSIEKSINSLKIEIDNRLPNLEKQIEKKNLSKKKYSHWKTKTFNKLNVLLSYINDNLNKSLKLSEMIHLIISEAEDIYNIEINDYVNAYKSEFELDTTPYVIDVINYYKDIKDMFTLTLDSIMEKLGIRDNVENNKNSIKNILNELTIKSPKN